MNNLAGKVALVSGSGPGIGRSIALKWSEQWRALGLRAPIQLQAEPS